MWTIIAKKDFPDFLEKYNLEEYAQDIVLKETSHQIILPRLFYKNYPYPPKVKTLKFRFLPIKTEFNFRGELRDQQKEIIDKLLSIYRRKNQINGIVKCPPGTGKTVMAVYLAASLGLKTCVVLDNSNLLRQWSEAFLKFTDLGEENIGFVQRDQFDLDKPVCIAMVQTLLSRLRKEPQRIIEAFCKAGFGLAVYDEVHSTSAAPKYAKASLLFQTPNLIGLSATPFHTGLQDILMRNTVGEVLVDENSYQLIPRYCLLFYRSNLSFGHWKRINRAGDLMKRKAVYNSLLVGSRQYLDLISKLTEKLYKEGHVVMVLVFTRKQVQTIDKVLRNRGLNPRRFYGAEPESLSPDERLIVATYSFCGKGFDFDRLSALVLASPLWGRKSLIQVIGRVLRLREDKKPPVVYDLLDVSFESRQQIEWKKKMISKEFQCQIEEKWGLEDFDENATLPRQPATVPGA